MQRTLSSRLLRQPIVAASNRRSYATQFKLIEDLATAYLYSPSVIPFVTSYTASIVLLTLTFRATCSLPLTLWQRRRAERLATHVMPELDVWAKGALVQARADSRQARRSYDQFTTYFTKLVRLRFTIRYTS